MAQKVPGKKTYEGEIKENRKIEESKQISIDQYIVTERKTRPCQGRDRDKKNSVFSVKTSENLPADFSEPVSELFLSCYQHTRQKAVMCV